MKSCRRIVSFLLALLVILSMPMNALAMEFDLYQGDVNITANESGQYNDQPDTGLSYTGSDVTITTSAPTDNTVTITTSGGDASVTLQDVTIDATGTGEAAVTVDRGEDTTVTIELDGTNTLQSDEYHAGLETRGEGELVIQDENGEAGSLEANGGDYGGAGIGAGNEYGDGSHITINSGTIEANGSDSGGAGIGGGCNSAADGTDITINGGSVTANGGHHAAGIGGGLVGDGTGITINGGTVTAIGGEHSYSGHGKDAAGIGGGRSGVGSDITITGGNVTAVSSGRGAGIGGGDFNHGENITITGGNVTAVSSGHGAGIGGGGSNHGENITITGGTIHAESKGYGAGIGGGMLGNGSDITITGGNVTAVSSSSGAGIGGGSSNHGENITITGGTIHAESKGNGAGIGGGVVGNGSDILIQKDPVITAKSGYGDCTIGGGFRGETINYDHSGLYTTGSINGVPGTVEPPVEEMPPVETPLSSGPEEEPVMTAKNIAYDRFWHQVEEQIRQTPEGQTVTVDAGGYASMPSYVMDAVAETGVTLVIQWFGGDDVVVDHAYSGSVTYYRFYFSVLPALLAD